MSFRINTNTQAARSLTSLNKTSNEIGMRQLRLSTGSRINSAADDSAGFTISNKLTAKTRGQAQALSNIGDAKSMLTVAEGSLGTTMDILQTIKEKAIQAGNSSMGADERAALQSQVDELSKEVHSILSGAEFNGTSLFSDTGTTALSFQVGDASGDTFGATIAQLGVSTLGLGSVAAADVEAVEAVEASAEVASTATVDVSASAGNYTEYGATSSAAAPTIDASAYQGDAATLYVKYDADAGNGGAAPKITVSTTEDFSSGTTDIAVSDFAANVATFDTGDGEITIDFGAAIDAQDDGAGFSIALTAYEAEVEAVEAVEGVTAGDFTSSIDLTTDSGAATALTAIDAAIKSVNTSAQGLGNVMNRLDFKAENLETSMNNYAAANSRIADADFAKEQMEIVKLQILQQTGSAMFAQSNASGQSVLSFF